MSKRKERRVFVVCCVVVIELELELELELEGRHDNRYQQSIGSWGLTQCKTIMPPRRPAYFLRSKSLISTYGLVFQFTTTILPRYLGKDPNT